MELACIIYNKTGMNKITKLKNSNINDFKNFKNYSQL